MYRATIISLIPFLLLVGCTSKGIYLPDNTLMLGEVSHVLTREQIKAGNLGQNDKINDLEQSIHHWGFTDQQIDSGRVFVIREGFYWHNTISGIKHAILRPALIPDEMSIEPGNVIEGSVGIPFKVVRVRAKNLEEGKCYYDRLPLGIVKGLLNAIHPLGTSGSATLYCAGIETDGWQRPRTYWHRLPSEPVTQK